MFALPEVLRDVYGFPEEKRKLHIPSLLVDWLQVLQILLSYCRVWRNPIQEQQFSLLAFDPAPLMATARMMSGFLLHGELMCIQL